jgi:hypothetical protein
VRHGSSEPGGRPPDFAESRTRAPALPGGALYSEEMSSHEPNRVRDFPLRLTPLVVGRFATAAAGARSGAVAPSVSSAPSMALPPSMPSVPSSAVGALQPPAVGMARSSSAKEPLWRHVIGDVLRRERQAQERTLKDVSDTARISMPYLSELERGRKEASSEVLAAAARALGLGLADLLVLAQAELARLTSGEGGAIPARVPVPVPGPMTGPIAGPAQDGAAVAPQPAPARLEPSTAVTLTAVTSTTATSTAVTSTAVTSTAAASAATASASASADDVDRESVSAAQSADCDVEVVGLAVCELRRALQPGGAQPRLVAWQHTMTLVA